MSIRSEERNAKAAVRKKTERSDHIELRGFQRAAVAQNDAGRKTVRGTSGAVRAPYARRISLCAHRIVVGGFQSIESPR